MQCNETERTTNRKTYRWMNRKARHQRVLENLQYRPPLNRRSPGWSNSREKPRASIWRILLYVVCPFHVLFTQLGSDILCNFCHTKSPNHTHSSNYHHKKAIIFSPMSVCLLTGLLKNTDQIFMKFYGTAEYNPEINWLGFQWPWPQGQNRFCK